MPNIENYADFDEAANRFTDAVISKLKNRDGVRIEDAIAAAASVCGLLLLRQTGIDISAAKPGSVVLTEGVNDSGPQIINFLSSACQRLGIDQGSGWSDSVPAENEVTKSPNDFTSALEGTFLGIVKKTSVPEDLWPYAAAFAALQLVKMGEEELKPDIGKAILVRYVVAGSKTAPAAKKWRWFGF